MDDDEKTAMALLSGLFTAALLVSGKGGASVPFDACQQAETLVKEWKMRGWSIKTLGQ